MTLPEENGTSSVVEVRPEVVFLYELLEELTSGRLRIPKFQRPFVWRRDQMTDLLDSVYNQYPIGSLLVWETDQKIATLERLGPFIFPKTSDGQVGYVLDGHQRLSTLAGALVARDTTREISEEEQDPARWELSWNMQAKRFQHGKAEADRESLFPLTALLDTLRFFSTIDATRTALSDKPKLAETYIGEVSQVARSFQHYRVPVIRIRQTGLSEAVEIFARLNSKGQAMSADQMVSALMYRQEGTGTGFDLAYEIDVILERLGERNFGDVDRTTILRGILANLDEDIYRTDWTRLTNERRNELLPRLRKGVRRASDSLDRAIDFLENIGVKTSRLLPYTMQLVLLSAFFDLRPQPSANQVKFLQRWFWVSSFSGWFGGANPSRVNSLVAEFRRITTHAAPARLNNFDMEAMSLPFPSTFDMRSARTRALLLVMLSLKPCLPDGNPISEPWSEIAGKGPSAVGHIFSNPPRELTGNPANRMIRPPGAARGLLHSWIERELSSAGEAVSRSHGINSAALSKLRQGDVQSFILSRQNFLISREREFQKKVDVLPSDVSVGSAPVDTD